MGKKTKIVEMYAWVGVDANGNESIFTHRTINRMTPMIAENRETIEGFRDLAFQAAKIVNSPLKLVKFSKLEIVENYPGPSTKPPKVHYL